MSQDTTISNDPASGDVQKARELDLRNDSAAQALKHARQELVKAQIQVTRVKRAKSSLKEREKTLIEDEQRWIRRANDMAAESEQKALDCLAHRVRCRVRLTRIRESLLAQEALESRLDSNFQKCKSRLDSLVEHGAKPHEYRKVAHALEAISGSS